MVRDGLDQRDGCGARQGTVYMGDTEQAGLCDGDVRGWGDLVSPLVSLVWLVDPVDGFIKAASGPAASAPIPPMTGDSRPSCGSKYENLLPFQGQSGKRAGSGCQGPGFETLPQLPWHLAGVFPSLGLRFLICEVSITVAQTC